MSDDSVGGRRRRRRRRRWLGDDPGRTIARAVVLTAALYVSYHSVDAKDSPTVVNIRASNVDQNMCPTKCSGTLLSNVIVLTAATCSGPIPEKPAAGNATGRASVFTTTTYAPVLKNAVKEGDIRVYVNQPNDAKCRNVTAKYLHPEFNQHSLVANLALLRLKKPFNEYSHVVMPLILDSNMLELPTNLSFKGFGMINLEGQNVINDKTKLNDNVMVRTLNVNYSGEMCFNSVKGQLKKDFDAWSFLCTEPPNVRTNLSNTLCANDVGGPLFSMKVTKDNPNLPPRLYGVFSHAYHALYPFCAIRECTLVANAPLPCNLNPESIFYKHTAMLGRYGTWATLTMERAMRSATPAPDLCTTKEATTLDPIYTDDLYEGVRFMMPNQDVCPKASSATIAAVIRPFYFVFTTVVVVEVAGTTVLHFKNLPGPI